MTKENVLGGELREGDLILNAGYIWRVLRTQYEDNLQNSIGVRWFVECEWSGIGADPKFLDERVWFVRRDDTSWIRVVEDESGHSLFECMQENHSTTWEEEE